MSSKQPRIGVVGLGYAGLCTAACMAMRFPTVGVEISSARVALLDSGKVPIHEKGLASLLKKSRLLGQLRFSDEYSLLEGSDFIFIAVGTPSKKNGEMDLAQIRAASDGIGKVVGDSRGRPTIVVKSTVVPGTTRNLVMPSLEASSHKAAGEGFGLCSNPEFLREGAAIEDTLKPRRIIIGPLDDRAGDALRSLYRRFYGTRMPQVVEMTPEAAELTKYASNVFLSTKISFINLMARVCEQLPGTDVGDIARGMGLDPRIGSQFLQAGPGFGGSCFPKDGSALASYLEDNGLDSSLVRSALKLNDTQPEWIVSKLEKNIGDLKGLKVAVLGLAFKSDSDDVRESRSFLLIKSLLDRECKVAAYDPLAMDGAKRELGDAIAYARNAKECITGADVAVVMTAWDEFKKLKPADFRKLMRNPTVFDARRIYDFRAYSLRLRLLAVGHGGTEGV